MALRLPRANETTVAPTAPANAQLSLQLTPEMINGSQLRLMADMGKSVTEMQKFLISNQNNLDLKTVNHATQALDEVHLEQSIILQGLKGENAVGQGNKLNQFYANNFRPPQGETVSPANGRLLDILGNKEHERLLPAIRELLERKKLGQRKVFAAWEERQTAAAALESINSVKATATQRAFADLESQDNIDESIRIIKAQNLSQGKMQGASNEWVMAQNVKDLSQIHERVISHINLTDPDGAAQYLKEHRDFISSDTAVIEKEIATRKSDIVGENTADDAFLLWKGGPGTPGDPVAAYAVIDNMTNPAEQKAARTQLNASITEHENSQTVKLVRSGKALSASIYEKNKDGSWVVNGFNDLDQEHLKVIRGQIDGAKREDNLRASFKSRNETIEPSESIQRVERARLSKLAKSRNPKDQEKFLKEDIELNPSLGGAYKTYFTDMQAELSGEAPKTFLTKFGSFAARIKMFGVDQDGYEQLEGALEEKVLNVVRNQEKVQGFPVDEAQYSELVNKTLPTEYVQKLKKRYFIPKPLNPDPQVQTLEAQVQDAITANKVGDNYKDIYTVNMFKAFSNVRTSNNLQEVTFAQSQAIIAHGEKDLVNFDNIGPNYFGNGVGVRVMGLTETEKSTAWIVTKGGQEMSLAEIDSVSGDRLVRHRKFMAEQGLDYTYQNRGDALEAQGTSDKRTKRRKRITTGTIKMSKGSYQRDVLYDSLKRNTLKALENTQREGKTKEALEILDFVIREKKRGIN